MKILIVNTRHYYGGGDSTYTFNLAGLLRSQGHAVAFFAMQNERNLPDENADLFVSHIDYREINKHKNIVDDLRVLGRVIYSREARAKFSQLLDRFKPDIVHLQNIHAHITPSVIFEARQRSIPVVWTLHDYKLVCPNSHFLIDRTGEICEACRGGRFWQATRKRCKKNSLPASSMASLEAYAHRWMNVRGRAEAFLCPSAFLRSKMLENGFEESKTIHLPLFLPDRAFEASSADRGYILFLGKLEPFKGIHVLLEAARRVPEVSVILAGYVEEPLWSQLSGNLPPNVTYAGFKTGPELADLLGEARALVLPSLWYENQPFSILEAFAMGKPVIASDLGGMSELVGGNERGLLIPPGDPKALAQAMSWMIAHPAEARRLGETAFLYVRQNHSAQGHYRHLQSIYRNIL
jgi:glycosyltransferase involved in cell wall biosynthesis